MFYGATRQPGNAFIEVDTGQSEILFVFHELSDLIIQKTQNVSLETSSDFKHCVGFELRHRRPWAYRNLGNVFNSLPA